MHWHFRVESGVFRGYVTVGDDAVLATFHAIIYAGMNILQGMRHLDWGASSQFMQ